MALMIRTTASRTTIAAAVSALNSSCGWRAQLKMVVGSAVYGPESRSNNVALAAWPKPAGRRADEQQRRRLAEGAGDGQDDAGEDARRRIGQHVAAHHLPLRGADAEARLADGRGHGRAAPRPR